MHDENAPHENSLVEKAMSWGVLPVLTGFRSCHFAKIRLLIARVSFLYHQDTSFCPRDGSFVYTSARR